MSDLARIQPLFTTTGKRPLVIQVASATLLSFVAFFLFFLAIPETNPVGESDLNDTPPSVQQPPPSGVDEPVSPADASEPPKPPGLGAALLGQTDSKTALANTPEQHQAFFESYLELKADLERPGPRSIGYRNAYYTFEAIRKREPRLLLNRELTRLFTRMQSSANSRMKEPRRKTAIVDLNLTEQRLIEGEATVSDYQLVSKIRAEYEASLEVEAELEANVQAFISQLRELDSPLVHAAFEPIYWGIVPGHLEHPLSPELRTIRNRLGDPLQTHFTDLDTDAVILKKALIRPFQGEKWSSWEQESSTLWQRELKRRAKSIHLNLSADDHYDADAFRAYRNTPEFVLLQRQLTELIPPELPGRFREQLYQVYLAYFAQEDVRPLQHIKVKSDMTVVFPDGHAFSTAKQSNSQPTDR